MSCPTSVKYLRVQEQPALVRDVRSSAILNTDVNALNKYKEERARQQKISQLIGENEQLKSDIQEIKALLKQVLGQRND